MEQNKKTEHVALNKKTETLDKEKVKKERQQREIENFKRKYFDYYDDIKISVKEDW